VSIPPLRERPAYEALARHYSKMEGRHLRELFAEDATRGERFCAKAAGIYLDYSKNRITEETLSLLFQLARQSEFEQRREMMFAGSGSTCPRTARCCTWLCGCRKAHR
jgi:glucose-6-phosphate isomerase